MPTSSWPYGTMAVGHPGSIVTPLGAEGKARWGEGEVRTEWPWEVIRHH